MSQGMTERDALELLERWDKLWEYFYKTSRSDLHRRFIGELEPFVLNPVESILVCATDINLEVPDPVSLSPTPRLLFETMLKEIETQSPPPQFTSWSLAQGAWRVQLSYTPCYQGFSYGIRPGYTNRGSDAK